MHLYTDTYIDLFNLYHILQIICLRFFPNLDISSALLVELHGGTQGFRAMR